MKDYLRLKMGWLVFVLIAVMISAGCPKRTPPPEVTPTKLPEEAPASPSSEEPAPPPPQSGPPSGKPSPPPKPVPLPSVTPAPPGETYFTHTVKWNGETLFIIAAWYTGDRNHWREISEAMTRANPNVNIHIIRLGDKIPVPKSLMKTQEPMTKEFVENFYKPKETPPPKPPPHQEPELFGPKEKIKKE